MNASDMLVQLANEHIYLFKKIYQIEHIKECVYRLIESLKKGNKILVCGNGGSASDSQHFSAELIGRFEKERESLPAIALTTDTSILTAVGNDYGYDCVFERQVNGLGREGDVIVGISTSGSSRNVIKAVEAAKNKKIYSIGLLGRDGGKLKELVDTSIVVPHDVTARIQEVHSFILHYWAAMIEHEFFNETKNKK